MCICYANLAPQVEKNDMFVHKHHIAMHYLLAAQVKNIGVLILGNTVYV